MIPGKLLDVKDSIRVYVTGITTNTPTVRVRKSKRSGLLHNTCDNYKTDTVLYICTPTNLTYTKTQILLNSFHGKHSFTKNC
jgi:hypothetical protein